MTLHRETKNGIANYSTSVASVQNTPANKQTRRIKRCHEPRQRLDQFSRTGRNIHKWYWLLRNVAVIHQTTNGISASRYRKKRPDSDDKYYHYIPIDTQMQTSESVRTHGQIKCSKSVIGHNIIPSKV